MPKGKLITAEQVKNIYLLDQKKVGWAMIAELLNVSDTSVKRYKCAFNKARMGEPVDSDVSESVFREACRMLMLPEPIFAQPEAPVPVQERRAEGLSKMSEEKNYELMGRLNDIQKQIFIMRQDIETIATTTEKLVTVAEKLLAVWGADAPAKPAEE